MTVVLHQPVDSITVHHAGHKAVIALEWRIPFEENAQRRWQAGLGKGRPHDHAIADPRTGVAPRPGLDGRAVAIDQDVRGSGAETIDGRHGAGRHLP